jgi:hypothetical protein
LNISAFRLAAGTLTIGAAALLTTGAAAADDSYATSRMFSHEADGMLRQVALARTALASEDVTAARQDLDRAQADNLRAVNLAATERRSMIVPVYGELVEGSVINRTVIASPPRNAATPSHSSAPLGYTVARNATDLTYVAVDLKKSGARIAAARTDLQNGNQQAARTRLGAVGSDFIVGRDRRDMPLLTARENLAIAHDALAAGNSSEAAAAVSAASRALTAYAASPGTHAGDARRLARDLLRFAPTEALHPAHSSNVLAAWWSNVAGWFRRNA